MMTMMAVVMMTTIARSRLYFAVVADHLVVELLVNVDNIPRMLLWLQL